MDGSVATTYEKKIMGQPETKALEEAGHRRSKAGRIPILLEMANAFRSNWVQEEIIKQVQ